ncbi:hypothetical protein [Streptomyces sp. NPDC050287]|uniref:hypothetical protein n=1 Tax=Streptomyces sp. NPDC050287 TaxID=3365608 RepID=UPI00378BDDA3
MRVPAVPKVLLFWIAFVRTRPLGATAGDFLTEPVAKGGLDLGTTGSSAVLLTVLIGLTGYAHVQERRGLVGPPGPCAPARGPGRSALDAGVCRGSVQLPSGLARAAASRYHAVAPACRYG